MRHRGDRLPMFYHYLACSFPHGRSARARRRRQTDLSQITEFKSILAIRAAQVENAYSGSLGHREQSLAIFVRETATAW